MKSILIFICIFFSYNICFAGFRNSLTPVTATETYEHAEEAAKALLSFDFVNQDMKLRNPLIVFEGYDPGYYTEPKEKEGRTVFQDFIDDVVFNDLNGISSQLNDLLQGNSSVTPNITQEYDIVYVNWVNGTDYLENNALVAEEVIRHVNWMKAQAGSTEPNVIIGKSMGSLIARMALRRMENRFSITGQRHNTRLYISLDGGHQGSNIPQGYQHMANQMFMFSVEYFFYT